MISKLGDKMWPQTDKLKGDRLGKHNLRSICKMRNERQTVGAVAIISGNSEIFHKVCVANGSND